MKGTEPSQTLLHRASHVGATSVWQDHLTEDAIRRDAKGREHSIKQPCSNTM